MLHPGDVLVCKPYSKPLCTAVLLSCSPSCFAYTFLMAYSKAIRKGGATRHLPVSNYSKWWTHQSHILCPLLRFVTCWVVYSEKLFSPSPNTQARGPPFVRCPLLLPEYIRSYPACWENGHVHTHPCNFSVHLCKRVRGSNAGIINH
jgi:hypothetical protein